MAAVPAVRVQRLSNNMQTLRGPLISTLSGLPNLYTYCYHPIQTACGRHPLLYLVARHIYSLCVYNLFSLLRVFSVGGGNRAPPVCSNW
jgi:hypothetical protein